MTATSVTYDPVLAELWPQRRVNNLTFEGAKMIGLSRRTTNFSEKVRHQALQYENPQGRSAAFPTAKDNVGSTAFSDFQITLNGRAA